MNRNPRKWNPPYPRPPGGGTLPPPAAGGLKSVGLAKGFKPMTC